MLERTRRAAAAARPRRPPATRRRRSRPRSTARGRPTRRRDTLRSGRGRDARRRRARRSGGRSCTSGSSPAASTPSARQAPRTNVVLPDAELAGDGDDVAGASSRASARRDRLGLLRRGATTRRRTTQNRPSWTGSARPQRARAPARRSRRRLGDRAAEQLREPREVLLEHRQHRRRVERRRRVVERVEHARVCPPSVTSCSWPWTRVIPAACPESSFVAKLPSVATTLRLDQLDLPEEMRLAGLDLLRQRVAVAGRPALEDVGDVDVRARRARCPRAACRAACRPGRRTGSPACPRGSRAPRRRTSGRRSGRRAEDDLRAPFGERAARAAGGLLLQLVERWRALRLIHRSRVYGRRADGTSLVLPQPQEPPQQPPPPPRSSAEATPPMRRRSRAACAPSRRRTRGSRGCLAVPDELLEVRLALHARVLVDRHRLVSLTSRDTLAMPGIRYGTGAAMIDRASTSSARGASGSAVAAPPARARRRAATTTSARARPPLRARPRRSPRSPRRSSPGPGSRTSAARRRSPRSTRTRGGSASTRCRRSRASAAPEQLDGAWAAVTGGDATRRATSASGSRARSASEPFALDDDERARSTTPAPRSPRTTSSRSTARRRRCSTAAGAPPEALVPLMRRTIENGFELTGPIARGDWETVERAPRGDPRERARARSRCTARSAESADGAA